ncbi:hypothetical protein B0H11DRAFT_1271763 [Mycena galericulata]|nr:hypothetical protein B0H11DRAFT_1271763 [Mycena galericulata]
MPVDRIASRRSRRQLTPQTIGYDEELENCELLYPESDAETPPISGSPSPLSIAPRTAPAPRVSHARQRPADHIPRPPNPFICFRTDYCVWNKQLDSGGVRDHRLVSKLAGQAWQALDSASREKYEAIAQEKKKQHALMYPDYAYMPTSRSGAKGKKRKAADDCDYEERPVPSKRRRRSRGSVQSLTLPARSSAPSPEWERLRTPELSPDTSSESPDPDLAGFRRIPSTASLHLELEHDCDFVATADIPPLDLYAGAPEQKKETKADRSLRPSSSFDVGTQFFKADISQQARDLCMWYNADGTQNTSISTIAFSPATGADPGLLPINYSAVKFTNPFQLEMEDLFHMDQL